MSLSKLEAPKDWVLISTTAITGTPASITLTTFGNYKDLLILVSDAATSASSYIGFRPNGSSTVGNYYSVSINSTHSLAFGNSNANASNKSVSFVIEDIDNTLPKYVSSMVQSAGGQQSFYYDASAVTTVDVLPNTGTFNNNGNIYLFGRY